VHRRGVDDAGAGLSCLGGALDRQRGLADRGLDTRGPRDRVGPLGLVLLALLGVLNLGLPVRDLALPGWDVLAEEPGHDGGRRGLSLDDGHPGVGIGRLHRLAVVGRLGVEADEAAAHAVEEGDGLDPGRFRQPPAIVQHGRGLERLPGPHRQFAGRDLDAVGLHRQGGRIDHPRQVVLAAVDDLAVGVAHDLAAAGAATLTLPAACAVQLDNTTQAGHELVDLGLRDLGRLVRAGGQRALGADPGVGLQRLPVDTVGDELRALALDVDTVTGAIGGLQVKARHHLGGPVDQGDLGGLPLAQERGRPEHLEGQRSHGLGQGRVGGEIGVDRHHVPAGDAGAGPLALLTLPGPQVLGGGLRPLELGTLLPAFDAGGFASGRMPAVVGMDRQRAGPAVLSQPRPHLGRGQALDTGGRGRLHCHALTTDRGRGGHGVPERRGVRAGRHILRGQPGIGPRSGLLVEIHLAHVDGEADHPVDAAR
jgi:hypothetical protein